MTTLDFSGGYNLPIAGKAKHIVEKAAMGRIIAVNASDLHGLKPVMDKQEGDAVAAGETLFHDKNDTRIKVVSPYSGKVKQIVRGPRRVLLDVVIEVSSPETAAIPAPAPLQSISEQQLADYLLNSGQWTFIKQMPFDIVADPEKRPKDIYVSCLDNDPLCPDLDFVLKDRLDDLVAGLQLLRKLTRGQMIVTVDERDQEISKAVGTQQGVRLVKAVNRYPSGSPMVQSYWVSPVRKGEVSWYIGVQDLLGIVESIRSGKLSRDRVFSVAGPQVQNPRYVKAPMGSPVSVFLGKDNTEGNRILCGSALTGRQVQADGYSGVRSYSVQMMREGYEREFLRFMRPGSDKHTYSKVFLSYLFGPEEYAMNTSINGEERACVQCGACESVCPTEVLPQFLFKAALANDFEAVQELGILDCANCGLCTYVCPSKIDLDGIIKKSTLDILKEG